MSDKMKHSDPFLPDGQFGGIDLSAHPTLQELPKDSDFVDHAFGATLAKESQGLRGALVKMVNDNAGDKEICAELGDIHPESEIVTVAGHEARVTYQGGDWVVEIDVRYEDNTEETLVWTGEDRSSVLVDAAAWMKNMLSPRAVEPSETAKLKVARLCGSGQTAEGLVVYLEACFPGLKSAADGERIWNDPQNVPIFNAACTFCWRHGNSSVSPSAEFLNHYLPAFANGRPYTVAMIEAAHQAYTRELSLGRVIDALPKESTAEEIVKGLDELTDEQVDNLRRASLNAYHRANKGAR